jgi:competence protein ComEC
LSAVLCLIAGLLLHRLAPAEPGLYLLITALLLIPAIGWITWPRLSTVCLAAALLLSGLTLAQLAAFYYPADDIAAFSDEEPRLVQVTLRIDEPPQTIPSSDSRPYPLPAKQRFIASVLSVRTPGGWTAATGTLAVQLNAVHPGLAVGQRCRVLGKLARFSPAQNPGQFDSAAYHRQQRQLAYLSIARPAHLRPLSEWDISPLQRLRSAARRALDAGFTRSQSQDHALLRALLLGERPPGLRNIQEDFRRTGTNHHLSTSGMHVAVVALLIYGICRCLLLPPRRCAWLALGFTLLYGLITVPSPPIVRSILLAGTFSLGILLRRHVDGIQLLALTALAMLAYDPLDLYAPGFQLTFLAVLALMLFTQPLSQWMRREPPGAEQARRAAPPGAVPTLGQRVKRFWKEKLIMITAAGLAAWFVSAPLVAIHFERFNPWSLLAGALLEPLVFASVIAGALKIILTALLPPLAPLLASLAAAPAAGLRHGVDALAHLPVTDLPLAPPPLWMTLAWYGCLLPPLLPGWRTVPSPKHSLGTGNPGPSAPRPWRKVFSLAPLGAVFLGVVHLGFSTPAVAPGSLRLTVLSVGAGQCAVLELPGRHAYLFDAGSSTLGDLQDQCLEPFLRTRGITRIDAMFISHPNFDHFSAAAGAVADYRIHSVYFSPYFSQEAAHNASARQLLDDLTSRHLTPTRLSAGRRLALNADTTLEVLWPPGDAPVQDNDASLVLKLTCRGKSILITGDIQAEAERSLLNDPAILRADLLFAPHHGSAESTTPAFVAAVSPAVIVSSNDHTLSQKQRHFARDVQGIPLYRTDRHGALTVTIENGKLRVEPFLK